MKGITVMIGLLLIGAAGILFAGGSGEPDPVNADIHDEIPMIDPVPDLTARPLRVVATTSIIGDVVERIAGSVIDLDVLIPAGVNPHGYQPAPSDFRRIEDADIVFINGFNLEEQLLDAVAAAATGYIVPVSAEIADLEYSKESGDEDHQHEGVNPHLWFNPDNVIAWTGVIEQSLALADPSHANGYSARADQYITALRQLDHDIEAILSVLPVERRKMVTDHELLTYYAGKYRFETIGTIIPGVSTSAEPSARDIARLVELLETHDVSAIFIGETSTTDLEKLARTVTQESGRDIAVVSLLTGALAAPGSPGSTYVDFMLENSRRIAEALKE